MYTNYIEEKKYIKAKKRVKKIKAFYAHALVNLLSIAIIVSVNVTFSPYSHWFWYPVMGILLATFIHWITVFGSEIIGYSKEWEEHKIKEYINNNN